MKTKVQTSKTRTTATAKVPAVFRRSTRMSTPAFMEAEVTECEIQEPWAYELHDRRHAAAWKP